MGFGLASSFALALLLVLAFIAAVISINENKPSLMVAAFVLVAIFMMLFLSNVEHSKTVKEQRMLFEMEELFNGEEVHIHTARGDGDYDIRVGDRLYTVRMKDEEIESVYNGKTFVYINDETIEGDE